LEQLLASISLNRRDVYICNVIKCRPPGNADPLPAQISACAAWLDRQLALIKPRMIVTLGRYSMAKFFPGESIGKIHGVVRKQGNTLYFPMYHPAAALHQPAYRKSIEEDIKKIPALLAEAEKLHNEQQKTTVQPKQLNLF
jgi:DNA polymerase